MIFKFIVHLQDAKYLQNIFSGEKLQMNRTFYQHGRKELHVALT